MTLPLIARPGYCVSVLFVVPDKIVTDRLDLYVNAEFSEASGDETRDFFMAGFKFSF